MHGQIIDRNPVRVGVKTAVGPKVVSELRGLPESVWHLLRSMPDGVLIHRGGTALFGNRALANMLGVATANDLIGCSVLDFIHPDSLEEVRARIKATEAEGRAPGRTEVMIVVRTGAVRTVDISVQLISLSDGPAVVVFMRDVTERAQMLKHLLQADRLSTVGTLSAAVVHEINNPLTFVLGNLAFVARELEQGDIERASAHDVLTALADARAGAERVRAIVGDLRAFARPDDQQPARLDVRRMVDRTVSLLRGELRHRAQVVKAYRAVPTVVASETRLSQLFLLLVLTAARSIEEGAAGQNRIVISTVTDPHGWARIEIRDTGRPFSQAELDEIWAPVRTSKTGPSTLILANCKETVREAGGEIWATDNSPVEPRFIVRFPPTAGSPDDTDSRMRVVSDGTDEKARVLVIDDEAVIGTMVRRALARHDVYVASSGRDGFELCREISFDVVLCDLLMPEMTGMAFYERLAQVRPDLKERIVFMTAGAFTARARRFLGSICNLVLHKPFELEDVERAVQSVLRLHGPAPQ